MNLSKKVMEKVFKLIEKEDDKVQTEKLSDEEIIKRLHSIELSINNHNETVEQNISLQKEIKKLETQLEKEKKKPLFPYRMNSGNRADFGEFYLISHAWFSFLIIKEQIGVIEVEYKDLKKTRKTYIGISTGTNNFKRDVLFIAQYGQKLRESENE